MNKCIRYADFEHLLTDLGLHRARIDAPQIVFLDDDGEILLIFPPYRPDDLVQPHHWMSARHTIDGMGILDRDEFDKRLDRCDMAKAVPNSV